MTKDTGTALRMETIELAGTDCPVAMPTAPDGSPCAAPGLLLVLDGARMLRRAERLVADGRVDSRQLPVMVGLDAGDEERLAAYTPWPHAAFKPGAPDFGGRGDEHLREVVLPTARAARQAAGAALPASAADGPLGLLGYSLGGLLALYALTRTDAFDVVLAASPSSWYPGFGDYLERTPLACRPGAHVAVACGRDEGARHPEPICRVRAETDRVVATLAARLEEPPFVELDGLDHHRGAATRLAELLARW